MHLNAGLPTAPLSPEAEPETVPCPPLIYEVLERERARPGEGCEGKGVVLTGDWFLQSNPTGSSRTKITPEFVSP